MLAAAPRLPEIRAVATIAAPADVAHVLRNFEAELETIEREGEAAVRLGGRSSTIRREFVEDAREQRLAAVLRDLGRPLLILHAPTDDLEGIDAARLLYEAARHPKSFVSLDGASRLLDTPGDARFAASLIAEWAERYLLDEPEAAEDAPLVAPDGGAAVRETATRGFRLDPAAGRIVWWSTSRRTSEKPTPAPPPTTSSPSRSPPAR